MSLNDDIPPRINLKINDVHTIKAEEEKEFYPCHQVDLLQLKEELLYIEKDHLAIEDTNLNKTENLEVKNEVESEILLNDASPLVNLNMKSNELRIKDFHTVKTKDGMVFYPCRFVQAVKHMYMIETPLTKACTEWFLWDPHIDGLQSHWSQLVCTSYAYSTDY
ncbi:uncharacterized protein LOC142321189 [Lycorma delicatula]|uniref:uncharacterized protein LOC142321189 n=1 Tax=Lycorma delicatula TaxID=130591 RepID=UPI003F514996